MNELSTQVNSQEIISLTEGAKKLHRDLSSFRKFLKKRNANIFKTVYNGRKQFCMSFKDFIVLEASKDTYRGNQHEKEVVTTQIIKAKEQFAEKGLEAMQLSNELLNDPFIQLRLKQLQQEQKINQQEKRIEHIEKKQQEAEKQLLELPEGKEKVEQISPRSLLNKIVYLYSVAANTSPETAWQVVYDYLYYCHHKSIKGRALNRGVKAIDIIEEEGLLEVSYSFIKSKLDKIH